MVALRRWSSRWTGLQTRITATIPARKNLHTTVVNGGCTQTWRVLIQYQWGVNPNLKVRCRQCNAWSERKTRRSKEQHHKLLHPRLHGNGIQAGGSLILSTRLKDGTTTDNTGKPVSLVVRYLFAERVSTYRRIWIFFLVIMKSVTADGSLRSPTGGVKGIYPAP